MRVNQKGSITNFSRFWFQDEKSCGNSWTGSWKWGWNGADCTWNACGEDVGVRDAPFIAPYKQRYITPIPKLTQPVNQDLRCDRKERFLRRGKSAWENLHRYCKPVMILYWCIYPLSEITLPSGQLERTCEGEVAVSKCEGSCSSRVRPSAVSHTGFFKDCQCCRETTLRSRAVTLNKCYDPNGKTLTGDKETYIMHLKEPVDCKCYRCGDSPQQ